MMHEVLEEVKGLEARLGERGGCSSYVVGRSRQYQRNARAVRWVRGVIGL